MTERINSVRFVYTGAPDAAGSTVNRGIQAAGGELQPKREYTYHM